MTEYLSVLKAVDLKPGEMTLVSVNGVEVVVTEVDGRLCAFGNLCPHEEGPLVEGTLEGKIVTCPWHSSSFDVTNGELVDGFTDENLTIFEVRRNGDDIEVAKP